MKTSKKIYLALLAVLLSPVAANADLIDNGTFDTNLDGWDQGGDIATTWDDETAHLGRPGTPGTSILEQFFDIADGTTAVSISFDYEWQVSEPRIEDFFSVVFGYDEGSSGIFTTVFSQGSTGAGFGNTVSFSTIAFLPGLIGTMPNGYIGFTLVENNLEQGTRIQLDNIVVQAVSVPEPGTLALLGLGLVGMAARRRKKV